MKALLVHLNDLYRSAASLIEIRRHQTPVRGEAFASRPELMVMKKRSSSSRSRPARQERPLRAGDNLSNHLPYRPDHTCSSAMMLGSWMGADITNDDVVKASSLDKF